MWCMKSYRQYEKVMKISSEKARGSYNNFYTSNYRELKSKLSTSPWYSVLWSLWRQWIINTMFYTWEQRRQQSEPRLSKERNIIALVGCPAAHDLTGNCQDSW